MAALSIATVIFVLALMNMAGMILVFAYLPVSGERRLLKIFAFNKLVHAASWFFRFLDTTASSPFYRSMADFLFVASCAIEAGVYMGFMRPWRSRAVLVYGGLSLALAVLTSLAWRLNPNASYIVLGCCLTLYLWLAATYLLRPPRSAFRAFLACAYFLLPPVLFVSFIMTSQEIMLLFIVPGLWGIILFASVFMVQMLLIFGFFLLSKELNEERMRILAETDSLTGAPNRRAFFLNVEAFLKGNERVHDVSVILMDLDHFKLINDSHGHETGDRVLQHFCSVVQASIREKDFFARFGGEEFVAFLPDTDRLDAELVSRRIHERLASSRQRIGEEIPAYTVSLGICTGHIRHAPELTRIISLSDRALYHSKTNGRNCSSWTGGEALELVEKRQN